MKKEGGFTIVELLIATAVFSVVLLGALAGFLEVGRLFYKGVSSTSTQTVANQILQDVSGSFRTNNNFAPGGSNGYSYYCIGNSRYTYNINHELDINAAPNHAAPSAGGNYGLLKDTLPGSSGCATPAAENIPNPPPGSIRFQNPLEMLGDKMRLSAFNITQTSSTSNFYDVSVVVAYGDDDAFDNLNDPNTIACNPRSGLEQFCSVSRLNTSLYKGFGL